MSPLETNFIANPEEAPDAPPHEASEEDGDSVVDFEKLADTSLPEGSQSSTENDPEINP